MFDLGPQTVYALIAVATMLLVGFPIHEYMHAYAAYRLGDNTARWQGRLTFDPRVHLEPLGALVLVLSAFSGFFIGWAKPTPVNPANLRYGRHGETIVAVAGPLSNLVIAAVVAIAFRAVDAGGEAIIGATSFQVFEVAINILFYVVVINIALFVFNLLPVPPLDGWRALLGLVPPRTGWQLRVLQARYGQFIPFVFLALILVGGGRIIWPIVEAIRRVLLGF